MGGGFFEDGVGGGREEVRGGLEITRGANPDGVSGRQ
jgi:hypothetical protein